MSHHRMLSQWLTLGTTASLLNTTPTAKAAYLPPFGSSHPQGQFHPVLDVLLGQWCREHQNSSGKPLERTLDTAQLGTSEGRSKCGMISSSRLQNVLPARRGARGRSRQDCSEFRTSLGYSETLPQCHPTPHHFMLPRCQQ